MQYKCKVLTPEFFARIEAEVKESAFQKASTEVPLDATNRDARIKARARMNEILSWSGNCMVWNRSYDKEKYEEIFSQWEFFNPEYTEEIFESKETGLQSQPRIEWKGKIEKVEDIREIFSLAII